MIQSCIKKAIAVVLFVFTAALFASPTDYLPAHAQVYGSINVAEILRIPEIQKYHPMLNEEIKESGLKVQDFDFVAAFAVDLNRKGSSIQANLTVAAEFKRPVAKLIFQKISNSDKTLKKTAINGKPALQDAKGEVRLIQYNDRVILLQGHMEGRKPFLPLSSVNPLSKAKPLLQNQIVLMADIKTVLAMAKDLMFDENDAAVYDKVSKINNAVVLVNYRNRQILLKGVFECATPKDAQDLAAFARVALNEIIKGKPFLKPILSTMYPKIPKPGLLAIDAKINVSDIENLMK